ncbi:hypothetical protein PO124_03235 [Bacillus licheniformis]|nr:hypothetical protein [Bacillus licheniformis]
MSGKVPLTDEELCQSKEWENKKSKYGAVFLQELQAYKLRRSIKPKFIYVIIFSKSPISVENDWNP